MNILVIGGSGLFGRKTVTRLLEDRDVKTVVNMDVAPPREYYLKSIEKYADRYSFVRGDLANLEELLNIMGTYKIDRLVNFISGIMTLLPGDVIATGTPSGIGRMSPGDIVEIKVEGIGTLQNFVVDHNQGQ